MRLLPMLCPPWEAALSGGFKFPIVMFHEALSSPARAKKVKQ